MAAFEYQLADHLWAIKGDLERGSYRPGPYVHFYIQEPKRRKISAAPFADRVVHHALCKIIEPRFERLFIADSYANRVGKGTHRAVDRLQAFAQRYRYVLRADIVRHFPSIDHVLLRETLARTIPEDDVLALVDRVLESGVGVLDDEYLMVHFPGDDLLAACRPRGLPIGNLSLLQNSPAQAAAPHDLLSGSNFCREESFLGRAAKLRAWFSSFGTNTLLHSSNAQQPERNGRGSLS